MADITELELTRNEDTELSTSEGAASQTVDSARDERTIIYVDNQDGANAATLTISGGDFWHEDIGDLEVEVAASSKAIIGPLEGARFKDEDGDITIAISMAGGGSESDVKLAAIILP